MIIRLEQSFLETTQKLNNPFTPTNKEKLSELIDLNYEKIMSIVYAQEGAKENAKPTVIELGSIGSRFFALSIYYSVDENRYDIPKSIQHLLPSISPVSIDIMATTTAHQVPDDPNVTYLKVGQVYDDGSKHSRYLVEVRKEDAGISPY